MKLEGEHLKGQDWARRLPVIRCQDVNEDLFEHDAPAFKLLLPKPLQILFTLVLGQLLGDVLEVRGGHEVKGVILIEHHERARRWQPSIAFDWLSSRVAPKMLPVWFQVLTVLYVQTLAAAVIYLPEDQSRAIDGIGDQR